MAVQKQFRRYYIDLRLIKPSSSFPLYLLQMSGASKGEKEDDFTIRPFSSFNMGSDSGNERPVKKQRYLFRDYGPDREKTDEDKPSTPQGGREPPAVNYWHAINRPRELPVSRASEPPSGQAFASSPLTGLNPGLSTSARPQSSVGDDNM